jgi:type I restriction enzyme M protein
MPWTKTLWIYDLRTNKHFTLKTNPLQRADLDDFVASYNPQNRHERNEAERVRDDSLEDSSNLAERDVIAAEIVDGLQAALEQFAQIAGDLKPAPQH